MNITNTQISPDATQRITIGVSIDAVLGSTSVLIDGVTSDSRALGSNSLFVAISGEHNDGHDHISDAVKRCSCCSLEELPKNKKMVLLSPGAQSRSAYAVVASNYQNNPSSKLNLIGVTGTDKHRLFNCCLMSFSTLGSLLESCPQSKMRLTRHLQPQPLTNGD